MKKIVSMLLAVIMMLGVSVLTAGTQAAAAQPSAGIVATSSGRLNVRAGQSAGSAVLTSLNKDSYVTLISKSGSWWYVEYADNKYGYVHSDYIRQVSGKPAAVQIGSGNLNVRSGAGTNYSVIDRLHRGDTVIVLSQSGGWSRVLYKGVKIGYVSSSYLRVEESYKYASLSLAVPSFKQTDRRWSNVVIGTSGKTIGNIGCTTTAIAMIESYRSGQTIYPDAMSKKLKYTSSGDLYWPGDYQAVQSGSNYLEGVYNQLKNNKPVLFGAKTSSGKQHWVVITGYTGGDSLTASRFTVNDPGSDKRTTLQDFMNEYPVFYKYFYYK